MTVLTGLNTFSAGTPAVASQVNTNFATIKTYVDGLSAGTNIDNGTLGIAKLSSDAIGILSPVGSVVQYVGANEPTNWKRCDGQALLIASYPDLYNLLTTGGTVFPWGANPSGTTFLLPNFGGRVPVGKNSEAEFDVLGETGGAKTVTLTEAQLASHTHANTASASTTVTVVGVANHGHTGFSYDAGGHQHTGSTDGAGSHNHTASTTFVLGGHNHDNLYDYLATGTNGASTVGGGNTNAIQSAGNHGHTFTTGAQAAHQHGIGINDGGAHSHGATGATSVSMSNAPAGSSAAHNNLQPYIVVNYIIKVL
jgi:microcystin-dependent protein